MDLKKKRESNMDHKPLSNPQDLQSRQYDPEQYQVEKKLGGRLKNGAQPLGKLRPWHVEVVKRHLMGYSNREVASMMGKHEGVISKVLNDPRCQAMVDRALDGYKKEFKVLKGQAIDAVRKGLKSGDVDVRLKAADMYFKQEEKVEKSQEGDGRSAEDVVSAIFERVEAEVVNVQVNVGTGAGSGDEST